ncbi:MAG: hypothetical protein JW888_12150 [Pirellulales bacterium]|nr:hypothetical protein [Pirellulales bacterium]
MVPHDSIATATPPRSNRFGRWPGLPPWVISVVLHVVLIVLIGVTTRSASRAGAAAERTAEVGIALKSQEGDKDVFVSASEAGPSEAATQDSPGSISREQLFSDTTPSNPDNVLPSAPDALGAGSLGDAGVGDATGATSGASGQGQLGQGKARVRVFGTEGKGYKFVYVFDRSGSMGGSGRSALRAAQAELLASLKSLDRSHQFQIVFYNQKPWQFNPSGQAGHLAFGTDRNKELARRFIGSMTAEGYTRHEEALMMAIRMRPDVIFFLTDADEPRLSAGQIEQITRAAAGISINAIEFGFGPQQDQDNFLVRLARATGGQFGYVDVSRLKPD